MSEHEQREETPLANTTHLPESEQSIMRLARKLYLSMIILDPGGPGEDASWDELTARRRDYYRLLVSAILEERELVTSALADDNPI
jgi:hypothetical protein